MGDVHLLELGECEIFIC